MTTDEALGRLRPDWVLGKADNYLTDEPGWVVHSLMNGKYYERLGWGKTPGEAIEAAEAYVEREAREQAERAADYARRKTAGQLTEWELTVERFGAMWSAQALREIERPSIFAGLVNRSFESDTQAGDTIQIRKAGGLS